MVDPNGGVTRFLEDTITCACQNHAARIAPLEERARLALGHGHCAWMF